MFLLFKLLLGAFCSSPCQYLSLLLHLFPLTLCFPSMCHHPIFVTPTLLSVDSSHVCYLFSLPYLLINYAYPSHYQSLSVEYTYSYLYRYHRPAVPDKDEGTAFKVGINIKSHSGTMNHASHSMNTESL